MLHILIIIIIKAYRKCYFLWHVYRLIIYFCEHWNYLLEHIRITVTQFGNEDLQNPMADHSFWITAAEPQAASMVRLILYDCKFPKTAIRPKNRPAGLLCVPACDFPADLKNMSNVKRGETVWGQQILTPSYWHFYKSPTKIKHCKVVCSFKMNKDLYKF